ncbi:MAG: GNAT family N-acetyltransferase [Gammaproteobacteria bacterium]|nr:GNAT family N-acetyltransferase [Gammaproteobacteria bacterium]
MATSVVSLIHINNHDSQRLAERNGLQRERLTLNYGTFADAPHYIYRISREQWQALQQPASDSQPFVVSTDKSRLDRALIHQFLSCQSYWAQGIPESVLNQALEHSLCFGGYLGHHQVAFARVVTDQATFANLLDVFVLPQWRGRGFSGQLLKAVMTHPDLQGLRRFMLATRDAHALYKRLGFGPPLHPNSLMERYQPDL